MRMKRSGAAAAVLAAFLSEKCKALWNVRKQRISI